MLMLASLVKGCTNWCYILINQIKIKLVLIIAISSVYILVAWIFKWSRGSLWTLKWRAKTQDSLMLPFLDFYVLYTTPLLLACVWKKNRAACCVAITLWSLWNPRWPPTGRHSTKLIFYIHVTFDLWLICDFIHTPFARHPVPMNRENML